MQLSQRNIILSVCGVITVFFLYLERQILTPFILAAVFAYVLSPIVDWINKRLKISKNISVFFVFFIVVFLIGLLSTELGIRLAHESRELSHEYKTIYRLFYSSINSLPSWINSSIYDSLNTISQADIFSPQRIWPYFTGALSGLAGIFVFLISSFYLLKDGAEMFNKLKESLPSFEKIEMAILFKKIGQALNNYLRGQVLLIILMAAVSWLGLSFLGVRYALIVGIFTGFAEVVPIIGPIAAGTVACIVAIFDGHATLGLSPVFEIAVVASMYFLFRQIEDIFVIPHVLGHATNLHPLVVLFAVLAGGHLWGIMGMILAVPIAAILRVTLEYFLSLEE